MLPLYLPTGMQNASAKSCTAAEIPSFWKPGVPSSSPCFATRMSLWSVGERTRRWGSLSCAERSAIDSISLLLQGNTIQNVHRGCHLGSTCAKGLSTEHMRKRFADQGVTVSTKWFAHDSPGHHPENGHLEETQEPESGAYTQRVSCVWEI